MEIVLSRYTNLLFGLKDTLFTISNDCFSFSDLSSPTQFVYHLNDLDFGFLTKDEYQREQFVIPIKREDDQIVIISLDAHSLNDFKLFCNYYNYYKYAYSLDLESKTFLITEQHRFNTNETILSLKLYSDIGYHKEILTNLMTNKSVIKSICDATYKKITTLKELYLHKSQTLELLLFLNEVNNHDINKSLNGKNNSDLKQLHFDFSLIDHIKTVYLSLCRFLFEIKRSFTERSLCPINRIGNKFDIIVKYILAKTQNKKVNSIVSQNKELKDIYFKAIELNKQYRDKLKQYLSLQGVELLLCFKCGYYLIKTQLSKSTCLFDKKCEQNSILYCKYCSIHFCNYCIPYFTFNRCVLGHLIQIKHIDRNESKPMLNNQYCSLCNRQFSLNVISYTCEECKLCLCPNCYDEDKQSIKKLQCVCGRILYWKRGFNTQCRKCYKNMKCHWYCFCCKYSFCSLCNKTMKNICGKGHKMVEINVNHFVKEKANNNQTNFASKLRHIKLKQLIEGSLFPFDSNCCVCQMKCMFSFWICYRCSYVKCSDCNK